MKEFFVKLALAAIAVLAPIHAVMITVGILIFADLFTGIWAARKLGQAITSARLRESVSKLCVYQVVLVTGFLVETHLIGGLVPVVKLVAGVIGLVELKSLIENASTILGKDLFREVLKRLGSSNRDDKQ